MSIWLANVGSNIMVFISVNDYPVMIHKCIHIEPVEYLVHMEVSNEPCTLLSNLSCI